MISAYPHVQPVGSPFITSSRLIPADKFSGAKSRQVLWERLVDALQNSTFPIIFAVAPYFYDDDGETSVNNAWRDSIWHVRRLRADSLLSWICSQVTSSELWSFNTTKQDLSSIYSSLSKSMDALRDFTPMSGAYLVGRFAILCHTRVLTSIPFQNEADVYEPDYEGKLKATRHHLTATSTPLASFWGAHYDRLVSIKKK